jgi:hypothetical protein
MGVCPSPSALKVLCVGGTSDYRPDSSGQFQVKLVFPGGDATRLLFGFDAEGKIIGVAIMSMAGD